ncbi:hypothetical protein ACEWAJ_08260 [Vibrio parahaemolyticus]|nr:hypothetical protein [Vibrio parahaemolyticus]
MKLDRLDETNYTTQLAADINCYVKTNSKDKPQSAYTPHSTKQSFKNINESRCFDLLYKITKSSLLILEVKVTHDGKKLHSFNEQQRIVDLALRKVGIPLDYCYNLKEDFGLQNDAEYTLENSMGAHPKDIAAENGLLHKRESHFTIKQKIDRFLKSGAGNAGNFGALFAKGLISSLQQVNTKLLFFSLESGNLDIYTLEEIQTLYNEYEKNVHLAGDVDLKTATLKELMVSFHASAKQLNEILEKNLELSHDECEANNSYSSSLTM